jgi:hypothetical protein
MEGGGPVGRLRYTVAISFQAGDEDPSYILVIVNHQTTAERSLVRLGNAGRIDCPAAIRPCGPSCLTEQNAHRRAASGGALNTHIAAGLPGDAIDL